MNIDLEVEDDFVLEELDRYKLTVTIGTKSLINTSNNIDELKSQYDEVVRDNLTNDEHIVVAIFDYDKNTDVYSIYIYVYNWIHFFVFIYTDTTFENYFIND